MYAIQAIRLTEGSWSITNDLLQKTGDWEFVPNTWKKTVHNTAIPKYPPGLPAIGSVAYLIGGLNGLFYLGPILTILFLIVSERIASNLFGKFVGFLTLLFLATNGFVFTIGRYLLSDNIFSLLTILGFFCLIKFFYNKKMIYILMSSSFFTFSSFIRASGIIYLPIECLVIGAYFLIQHFKKINQNDTLSKDRRVIILSQIKIQKVTALIIGPWLVFIVFFLSFNEYYFEDPLTTFYGVPEDPWVESSERSLLSVFEPKKNNFEVIKSYSNFVLPYPLYKIEILDFEKIQSERNDPLTSTLLNWLSHFVGGNNLGLFTFLALFCTIAFSFYTKEKIGIIIIFSLVVFTNILFWSANHIFFDRDSVLGRYMMASFSFFSMTLSFLIVGIFQSNRLKQTNSLRIVSRILKFALLFGLFLFFMVALYNSPMIYSIKNNGFEFRDPAYLINYYPLDLEGLSQNSIIVGGHSAKIIDYGFNTFDPFVGYPFNRTAPFNPDLLSNSTMQKLKDLVSENNNVFVFKELVSKNEEMFRHTLVQSHGFILKDYSKSFCKLQLIKPETGIPDMDSLNKTDEVCYGFRSGFEDI
ncbi:MAG: hypothetical protein WEC35_05320 [Nitrosopumilaceae archaeon]